MARGVYRTLGIGEQQQVAKAIWRRSHRICGENRDSHLIQSFLGLQDSLHSKQDLDPLSRVCTAKSRDRLADAGNIDCSSPHFTRSLRPQIANSVLHLSADFNCRTSMINNSLLL